MITVRWNHHCLWLLNVCGFHTSNHWIYICFIVKIIELNVINLIRCVIRNKDTGKCKHFLLVPILRHNYRRIGNLQIVTYLLIFAKKAMRFTITEHFLGFNFTILLISTKGDIRIFVRTGNNVLVFVSFLLPQVYGLTISFVTWEKG